MNKIQTKRFAMVAALAAVAALASGCGQQAYNEGTAAGGGTGTTSTGGGTTSSGGTTGSGTGGFTSPTATTTTTSNGSPNYSYHIQMTGAGTATQVGGGAMNVTTDTVLKISVTAGNGMPLSGTGYSVGFNCQQFNIKVGNSTQSVFVKKNGYTDFMLKYGYMSYDPCANAPTTWTGDFSSALGSGHQTKSIVINGMYIDNCRLYSDPYDGGCGLAAQYSTYTSDAYLQVFTD